MPAPMLARLAQEGGSFTGGAVTNSGTIDHRDGGLNISGTLTNPPGQIAIIVNASRAVLYASQGADFAQAARLSALSLKHELQN